ncbi:hypothetical protein [Microbacterium paraoxydans]|uniref:hypothetical protein n=1 Tax=Microbacterium paraoxydans TaxID=199592 RepID=UPI0030141A2E
MVEWFLKSFEADPAGWIGVFITLGAVALSAVFWRRLWAALKFVGRGAKMLTRLQVTVEERPRTKEPLMPVRWVIGKKPGTADHEFVLANAGEGSIARHVILDTVGDDARIVTSAAWAEIPGNMSAPFSMRLRDRGIILGTTFVVEWTDARGKRRSDSWTEHWD